MVGKKCKKNLISSLQGQPDLPRVLMGYLFNLEPRACIPFDKNERLWITPMRYVI